MKVTAASAIYNAALAAPIFLAAYRADRRLRPQEA
jgi:hypothetical protein